MLQKEANLGKIGGEGVGFCTGHRQFSCWDGKGGEKKKKIADQRGRGLKAGEGGPTGRCREHATL